jgi:hypothetical protein
MTRRYSSGKLRLAGAAAGSVALLAGGAFLFQQWQLNDLNSQWAGMRGKVKDLQQVRLQTHQFSPWYDDGIRGMAILSQITLAFPEEASVSAKTIEIRDLNAVSCSGVAKDSQSLLRTIERLSTAPGVSEFHRATIRGRSPINFTFDFRWSPPGPGAAKKESREP